ncbi:MAG TPA: DoxX family protein [Pseudonocardia sp.]|jgi:putative oxidoreductase|uniref:DoxX family protein n=1 Tax=Pseudonocardia sp. TaxID=60912 RepID=UPI002B6BA600|nr:DoxX family protein [Pseudonocardia sp.]HTF45929.1 DoxX family protein [Pseudonocardia sp.]
MVDNVASVDVATARPGRAWHVVLWVLQVLGAVSFLLAGYQKLAGSPDMVALFAAIGAGQWFRFLTGTLEILGGIALLIPRLRALGALGLVGVMIGALITNFTLGMTPLAALVELVIVAVILWGRRRELTPSWILRGE